MYNILYRSILRKSIIDSLMECIILYEIKVEKKKRKGGNIDYCRMSSYFSVNVLGRKVNILLNISDLILKSIRIENKISQKILISRHNFILQYFHT